MSSHYSQQCGKPEAHGSGGDDRRNQPLTAEQLGRWAALIADERSPFPQDLSAGDRQCLMSEVRRRLRERLLGLVARSIAREIHRRDHHDREVP